MPCSGANSAKPRSSPKPNAGPELHRCGSRAPGTRTQAKPAEKNQARLHRRGPKPRAHSYPGGSRRVRRAQKPADGSSCRPTKAGRRRQQRNGRTRRPCRIAFIAQAQLGQGIAWPCIVRANSDLRDENLIHEGQVLFLPSSCELDRVAHGTCNGLVLIFGSSRAAAPRLPYFVGAFRFLEPKPNLNDQEFTEAL